MRWISKRRALAAVVAAGAACALAVPAAGIGSRAGSGLPTKIGKGEGALNLIEWPAYSDPSFAKPFERQTGCKIKRKDAGSSNQMVALMHTGGGGGGGQYDLVSASGDASLRLIYGHDVVPINIGLIPSWKDFLPAFKSPPHNTVGGKHYGVSLQWGPNTLLYNTRKVKPAPTSWSAIYSPRYKGKVSIPNNPIQIADAALYLMKTRPALGIKDPYELTKAQFDATVSLLKQQKPLVKRYWNYASDQIQDFKNGDAVIGATWPYQTLTLQAAKVPVKELIPKEGATGWADTWMLAAKAPHPNCAYLWMRYVTTPQVQAKQAIVFGETPVNPKACPFMNKIQAGACAQYHLNAPASYSKSIRFWKTPVPDCGWTSKEKCMDYTAWQQAWTQITG
ncbi:MAG TPA: ABC transporter substrate-binding protein [Gaiellaceae bacterium]|nr:ABC transporter substrate-binding protein [Gaiellaceae bacterium]